MYSFSWFAFDFLKNKYLCSVDNHLVVDFFLSSSHSDTTKLFEFSKKLVTKKFSKATYYYPIRDFVQFTECNQLESVEDVNGDDIYFFISLYTDNKSLSTAKKYKTVINMFIKHINKTLQTRIDFIPKNTKRGTKAESNISLQSYLNEQEMLSFLMTIRAESNKKYKSNVLIRNILIVKLLFFTGARINEILMLTCDSIIKTNEEKGDMFWIKLKGKRHKERMVCIRVSHIEESLANWMHIRRKLIKNNNVSLMFFNSDYKPLSGSSVNIFIKKQLNSIGLTKIHMGPHLLRHSFATLLYAKTNDLLLVSEVLGHSNMSITILYTHIDTMKKWIEIAELFG